MARLIRCDRCQKEVPMSTDNYAIVEVPIINRDEPSGDVTSKELCFSCLQGLWNYLNKKS